MMSEPAAFRPLPAHRLSRLEGWGMVDWAMGYLYRPSTIEGIRAALKCAHDGGHSIVPRGAGYSYGDLALNGEQMVLDLSRFNRVLDWNPDTGIIRVEPGVTIRQLWCKVIEDGWWPPVVPGTMYPTLGGCASVNAHGKNNWLHGVFGEHVVSAEILLPSGETRACGPQENADLFRAVFGGLGMLGILTCLTLRLKPVTSGLLEVQELAVGDVGEMLATMGSNLTADYLVGWVDGFAGGAALGRGLIHIARHVEDDPRPFRSLQPANQDLSDCVLGVVPRSKLWIAMKPAVNDTGMRSLNWSRFRLGSLRSGRRVRLPHAQFHFFHDYIPDWKRSFQPGGIIQYQVFVPKGQAADVFRTLLERSRRLGFTPYLTVLKPHRRDDFLLSYGVDGFSLSLDYHATWSNQGRLRSFLLDCTRDVVLPGGGRFYAAKDTVLDPAAARASLSRPAVEAFLQLKRQLDPGSLLQSNLYRRIFGAQA